MNAQLLMRTRNATGHRPAIRMEICVVAVALVAWLSLLGCVSKRYQAASKKTPPAVALNLRAEQPPLTAELNTVIVFHGAGSWKREAYWDEYVVSLINQGPSAITIDGVVLDSSAILPQTPGSDPWAIEKQSHKILKDQTLNRRLVADAGPALTVIGLETGAVALGAAAVATGTAAAVAGATVAVVALPVFVVGSGIRGVTAPYAIQKEFNRRRLPLPLELQPGETRQGSLFFPITPGPQRLELHLRSEDSVQSFSIDLAQLSALHFAEPPPGATAAKITPH